jgi:hypothetical protein
LVNISIERKVEFYKKIKYKGVKLWKLKVKKLFYLAYYL